MKIKAVIWDFGGVLVRTEDRSKRILWEQELQLEPGELDRLVFEGETGRKAALGKAQAADIWQALGERFTLSDEDRRRLEQDFWAGDHVDQEFISLIRRMRPRLKTGLLSNAWPDLRHAIESVWKIADAFDEIVISAEVGFAKPDPRMYQLILDRLGVDAPQAVFIDDFVRNIEAAKQLGFETIHFNTAAETQSRLKNLLYEHSYLFETET
ncbi:MAG: HAD family phosphatase [Anaerolineales bacterium]|nr:MAG: HAD family phosphatase [Anaerolineales bacterium]